MAVDQVMRARRAIARTGRAREDHGIAFGGAEGGFQADLPAVLDQPLRAGFEIGFVLGLRRNAGETEISTEIVNETLLVLLEVIEDGFVFQSKLYKSLTAIARNITGAHWSGPRFFGL